MTSSRQDRQAGTEGDEGASSWPATPQEMPGRLRRAVSYLQAEKRRFWDPGYSAWCASRYIGDPRDMEKACKEASLHAELWENEGTGEGIETGRVHGVAPQR